MCQMPIFFQETATRFVDRLSNEYSEYVDIVQPIQLAIYEMKLGLSLVMSSNLRNQFLDRVGQNNIDDVLVKYKDLLLLLDNTIFLLQLLS